MTPCKPSTAGDPRASPRSPLVPPRRRPSCPSWPWGWRPGSRPAETPSPQTRGRWLWRKKSNEIEWSVTSPGCDSSPKHCAIRSLLCARSGSVIWLRVRVRVQPKAAKHPTWVAGLHIVKLRVHAQRQVGGQGPRGGRPRHQVRAILVTIKREGHNHRRVCTGKGKQGKAGACWCNRAPSLSPLSGTDTMTAGSAH